MSGSFQGQCCNVSNYSRAILDNDDQNLFLVDWGAGAKTTWYNLARYRVENVAQVVSELITFLVEDAALKLENVTLIGFSLGAHIVGLTGKKLKGKVRKIVALDPAGVLFLSMIQTTD